MNINKFDVVMDYIDAHIFQDIETIKKGIINQIGYNSNSFGHCFSILTGGETLFHYITSRKLFFAAKELYRNPNKPMCEIALDCGYSEQSSFSRAMKSFYGFNPTDVRKEAVCVPNNRYRFNDFYHKEADSHTQKILNALENDEFLSSSNWELFGRLEEASEPYGFDIDTCYQIADLAEKLEVSVWVLLRTCQELLIDVKKEQNYIPPDVEAAIHCGIESDEELTAICEFYNCKVYDLDHFMVEAFRNMK